MAASVCSELSRYEVVQLAMSKCKPMFIIFRQPFARPRWAVDRVILILSGARPDVVRKSEGCMKGGNHTVFTTWREINDGTYPVGIPPDLVGRNDE